MKIENLQGWIIALVIVGIVLGFAFIALNEFTDRLSVETHSVINESVSSISDGGVYLANNFTSIDCFTSLSIAEVIQAVISGENDSGGIIEAGNYTYEPATGRVWNITSDVNTTTWNITYTYKDAENSTACVAIESTIDATAEIPDWLDIVIILVIVAIVLFIVMKVFPKQAGGEGGGVAEI